MDLFKILFIISVTTGVSVSQDWLYTPPLPSEAIAAANSILTRSARPIDEDISPAKFNQTEGILNGSLITPPEEDREERAEVIQQTATTVINELPAVIEDFNDITDGLFRRLGKPFGTEYETNDVLQEDKEGFLESLGRAIGGGGVPGADFPIHYRVPETDFSCGDGSLVGYYADIDPKAACQVFHICQEDGRHDSFLCPIGTLFNQKYFVCDWWYNVDCNASVEFYSLNEFLIRENFNRGLKPIKFNLQNRTETFEQIIEEIRNIKTDSKLFANKHSAMSKLFDNLNITSKIGNKFEESDKGVSQSREIEDESLGMENKDGQEEVEAEEALGTKAAEKVGEKVKKIEKGSGKKEKEQKGDKEEKKEKVKAMKEKEKFSDKPVKTEVVEGEEVKPESFTETIEEERILNEEALVQNEQQANDEEKSSKPQDSIESETKVAGEPANKSNNKNKDSKKESTKPTSQDNYSKKENTTTNKANQIGLQNGSQTSNLGEPFETPTESKDNNKNDIKNGLSSTTSNNEEVIGYTYKNPKDGNEIESLLNKKSPSLNSYGVVTDNLVNKKGIRN